MKKFAKIFVAVAGLFVGFACTTDVTEDLGVNLGGQTTVTLSLEESRTSLGAEVNGLYPVVWSGDDDISINGVKSSSIAVASNAAVATFSFNSVLSYPYEVAYPAAAEGKVVFADQQSYTDGSFVDGAAVMYGYAEATGALSLKHLTGVLKIGITGSKTLSYAQISTADRAPIAGEFEIDFTTGEVTPTKSSKEIIGYSFPEDLVLASVPQYIHVAVPAGVYDELYVTLYDTDGGVMYATVKADDSKPLAAGKVREFSNAIPYEANASVFVVKDQSSLLDFASQAASLDKDVLFVNDVDMTDVAWTPIEGYSKTVLGNGYAINGLTAPLFGTTSASIKGLHLKDVVLNSNDVPQMGALVCVLQATETTVPTIEHCSVSGTFTVENKEYVPTGGNTDKEMSYGGLVGIAYGANINDCVNNMAITVNQVAVEGNTTKVRPYVAGIVACCYYTSLADGKVYTHLNGCVNNAPILYKDTCCKADNLVVTPAVGGIVAGLYHDTSLANSNSANGPYRSGISATFTNCTNYGDITIKANGGGSNSDTQGDAQTHAAGVLARGAYVTVKDCSNYGKITLDGTFVQTYSGGVCGASWYSNLDNCHNYGAVSVSENTLFRGIMLAGISSNNYSAAGLTYYTNNCSNNAPITCLGSTNPNAAAGGLYHYRIGGCEGFGRSIADGLTNNKAGKVTCKGDIIYLTKSKFYWNVGGVTAYRTTSSWKNVKNYADVDIDINFSIHKDVTDDASLVTDRTFYVGGIAGYSTQSMPTSENHGNVTINGTYGGEHLFVGGAAGYGVLSNDFKNYGTITIGENCQLNSQVFLGGVIGSNDATGTYTGTINYGDIFIGGSHTKAIAVGGVAGQNRSGNVDLENYGDITVTAYNTAAIEIAGVIGYFTRRFKSKKTDGTYELKNDTSAGTMTNAKNHGDFYVKTANSTGGAVNIGGVCKQGQNSMIKCVNNGHAYVTGSTGGTLYYGGIATANSACLREDCVNNGNIIVSSPTIGTTTTGADCFLGGLCYSGGSNTTYRRCVNNGDIIIEKDVNIANCCRIGGLIANVETSTKLNNIEECVNNGDIIVKGNVSAQTVGVCRLGGIFGQFTNGTVKVINGLKNTGTIEFAGLQKQDTGTSLGGIIGGTDGSVAVWHAESTGNIINEGEIKFTGKTVGSFYVGGFSAYQNASVPASPVKIINTGDITCTGTAKSYKSATISGICGNIAAPLDNVQCFCNIYAPGYGEAEIGMLTGKARTAAITYTNANVGGTICVKKEYNNDTYQDEDVIITLVSSNYMDYIYKLSSKPDWASLNNNYDGCKVISSAAEIDYSVITPEPTPAE